MHDLPAGLRDALAAAGIQVVTDPALLAGHCVDWTGRWRGPALASVRPRSTEEVAQVLVAARAARVAVQVQGGNTGLVGGSVPDRPALLMLTTALDRLDPVDSDERTVVVGAGVTAARLAAHARAAGLHFGVDLASRDSATVGGLVATNAGGIGVCAYGMMRAQVRGLGGGARRRARRALGGPSAQGQLRLRPDGPARRQRGHARGDHRGGGGAAPTTGGLDRRTARRARPGVGGRPGAAGAAWTASSCSPRRWSTRRRCPRAADALGCGRPASPAEGPGGMAAPARSRRRRDG